MASLTKILFLIPTLERHGAEKQLTLLATHLPREEFDVHVGVLTYSGPYEADLRSHGVPVTLLNKRFRFDPRALLRLRRLIDEVQPDILHTWLFAANSYGRLAVGRRERPLVVVSERCVDTWKRRWQLWMDRRLIPRTARLVGNSNSVAQFYRHVGVPEEILAVVPNAIDVGQYSAPDEDGERRARLLREMGVPEDAKVIGSIGRIARQKRVDDLIWAEELLRQIDENAHLIIAGDGPELESMKRFADQIRVSSHVHFLGHRDDVAELLQVIDIFWLASDFEGQSNSLMEAMASGIPVIASDIPPNRELVTDGQTGFLVPVGDRVSFARTTGLLLADPNAARTVGNAARERMCSEFSLSRMVDRYATLYRDVLERA